MTAITRTARCLCGASRITTMGEPLWIAHCHCQSCRRASGAASLTRAGFHPAQV